MLISLSLMILIVLVVFASVLGADFVGVVAEIEIDTEALVDGASSTFVIESETVIWMIDTTVLINAGITILITMIIVAGLAGLQVLSSGLNPEASKIIIMLTTFIGIWTTLSQLAWGLIMTISIFGSVIWIALTIAYSMGVIQKLMGDQ